MLYNKNSDQSKNLIASHLTTPLGAMLAITDETHLYMLGFIDQKNMQNVSSSLHKTMPGKIKYGMNHLHELLQQQLNAYFQGTLHKFTIPLNPIGTDFQNKAWQALLQIPYGATTSYGHQAIIIGNPKAYRAVANANGKNPIAIIIPCHRIIKSNGDLCGYNGGVSRKQALLELEKKNFKSI